MRRSAMVAAAALAVIALVTSSLAFANSTAAEMVAQDASAQVRATETLAAATTARSLLREAVTLRLAGGEAAQNQALLQEVSDEASATLTETSRRADGLSAELGGSGEEVENSVTEFVASSRELLEAITNGQPGPSIEALSREAALSFDDLSALLVRERDQRERHIAAVRAGVGKVAQGAAFLVAFVVPAATILAVIVLLRRRQRRELDQEQHRRELELRHTRDEFLTAVAHELRTPLTAVVGSAQMLRSPGQPLDATTRDEMIDILADQAVDVADLLEDLLVFARANVGDLSVHTEVVDVRTVIDTVTARWSDSDSRRIAVRGDAEVLADTGRLKQVMRNLLSNALRFGGDGIEVRIIPEGTSVLIQVADDGPGIPEDLRQRMFDPYEHGETTSQPATLGLGLTVARALTQRMGGELGYEGIPGSSMFTLTLPTARRRIAAPRLRPVDGQTPVPVTRITRTQISEVIKAGALDVVFQPIVHIADGEPQRVVGVEALARFPVGSPEEWFEAAATVGLRRDLELVAIRSALQAEFEPHLFVSINLSIETLTSPLLLEALAGTTPNRVILELTEASIINHYHQATDQIKDLRARGYRLAVDDMGTAHTDLWHLVRLRPAYVKPHMSLIRDSEIDSERRAVMTGLHWLANTLPIALIAEAVEQREDLDKLRRFGIDWAQGYLFARPACLEELDLRGSVAAPSDEEASVEDPGVIASAPRPPHARPAHVPSNVVSIRPDGKQRHEEVAEGSQEVE